MSFRKPFAAVPMIPGPLYRAELRRRRFKTMGLGLAEVFGVIAIGGAVGAGSALIHPAVAAPGEPISGCAVTDGDTIRCNDERIRLLGIDAPELPGHCRQGRLCVPGDPYFSTTSLDRAMTGDLRITRFGEDRYGRTLAAVSGNHGDLSCWQIKHGQAVYKPKWDNQLRIARTCPSAII